MKIENNKLISIDSTDIVDGTVIIPESVTEIGDKVFLSLKDLKKVIGLKVTKIGNDNFKYCKALTTFEAPVLTEIGNDNFKYCKALTTFEAPVLAKIGNDNFKYYKALTSFEAPVLTEIGNDNFRYCNALTSFEAPVLAKIGNANFSNYKALTTFEAPVLTEIGNDNFYNCNALTTLKFKNYNLQVTNVDGDCFVIENKKKKNDIIIYSGYNFKGTDLNGHLIKYSIFVAEKNEFTAHGSTIKLAVKDLQFKINVEKLKSEPITLDTEITVMHYRIITGACELGCKEFMDENNIEYNIINREIVEKEPIKAKDLLPLLEKKRAYGLEKFKNLIKN